MITVTDNIELAEKIGAARSEGRLIAFVPTMGALHQGHLSLVELAQNRGAFVVCSIFVNPTQFNNPEDLAKYPRTIEEDTRLLQEVELDVLYAPTLEAIYPSDLEFPYIDLGGLDQYMEGAFRPGHFQGVAQVVWRLLQLVKPDLLVMGQKDYQQYAIIQYMVRTMNLPVEMLMAPTQRAANGLALSSRNQRLTVQQREQAGVIYQVLDTIREEILNTRSFNTGEVDFAREALNNQGIRLEYLVLADGDTLEPIARLKGHHSAILCIAAHFGSVRLIDNVLVLKK